jgi:hypothetical protein
MNPRFDQFRKQIIHPIRFRLFMLQKLPSALFAGLRVDAIDAQHAAVSVKYKWFNQNPFRSMYFAIQSMAAEMSTGLLGFGQIYQRNPAVSMLVVGLEAKFIKKITGRVTFTCSDGDAVSTAIDTSIANGQGIAVTCRSVGTNEAGELVAEFFVTWSFKVRSVKS